MNPDLPMELWLRVIHYLCLKDRRNFVFAQVNRQFLDLAQDELFSHLNLTISVPFLLDSVTKRVLQYVCSGLDFFNSPLPTTAVITIYLSESEC